MTIDAKNVLRLNMPPWQGEDRPAYRLGAKVLAAIAPEPQGTVETIAVPPSARLIRRIDGGITSRAGLLDQLNAARSAIVRHKPEAIVTLGGDCLVDLSPIAYLSERYGDDLAVLWVDAHPDVMGPAQTQNAHAHVLAILMDEFAKALNAYPGRAVPKWLRMLRAVISAVERFLRTISRQESQGTTIAPEYAPRL